MRRLALLCAALLATTLAVTPPVGGEPLADDPVGPLQAYEVTGPHTSALGATHGPRRQVSETGYVQDFVNGRLYATERGVFAVHGAAWAAYSRNGAHGALGFPTSELQPDRAGRGVAVQEFEGGLVVVSGDTGWVIAEPVLSEFRRLGGFEELGLPREDEVRSGRFWTQRFERGRVSASVRTGQDSLMLRRDRRNFVKSRIAPGESDYFFDYGRPRDVMLVGDWDGDGIDTLAVRRGHEFHLRNSLTSGPADVVIRYGRPNDVVLVGDWNGDGTDTLAVRRGRTYHIRNSLTSGPADVVVHYGRPNDVVLVGDWNGDGTDTLAVRRGRTYYIKNDLGNGAADSVVPYGHAADVVLVGDWDGDGVDTLTVRRGNQYHVKNSMKAGAADRVVVFGRPGDQALVGNWDGKNHAYREKVKHEPPADIAPANGATMSPLSPAWANNSVNATVFRRNSVVSHEVDGVVYQFTAYYDENGALVLARRAGDGRWEYERSTHTGNPTDAHNSISIAVDGNGFLHVSWGHHNSPLSYARSVAPLSLELGPKESMVGRGETLVTYPEFYRLPDGGLFFLYRFGRSGAGDLVLNRYDPSTGRWTRVHDRLLDGEGQRNPYWQATVDSKGRLHLSWTWRRTGDVRTNHDVSYARSIDDTGVEWERSDGRGYALPVTRADAEVLATVPENSNLINQTSIAVDDEDQPVIATYWSDGRARSGAERAVQYRIIEQAPDDRCADGRTPPGWCIDDTGFLTGTAFELGGFGTLAIPISRPQVLAQGSGADRVVHLVFRAHERGQKVSIATRRGLGAAWDSPVDLTQDSVEDWEPSYDTEQWRRTRMLNLYVQRVNQVNNEGISSTAPQRVYVLSYPLAAEAPPAPAPEPAPSPTPSEETVPTEPPPSIEPPQLDETE